MIGNMKVTVTTTQCIDAAIAVQQRRDNMMSHPAAADNHALLHEYHSTLNAIGYSRGTNWIGALKRRYKLKELHAEIVKRGLTV